MRGERAQVDLPMRPSTLALWDVVAGKAGFVDVEELPQYESFPNARQTTREHLWTMVAVWERVVAAGLFLFVFPVLFITAVLVIVLSRRSPFIAHRRVGERGRELWILKLRTMWQRKPVGWNVYPLVERIDDEPMSSLKLLTDARVTNRFAFLCRRYSVDELPQLLQVAMGDLALVGPRPLTKGEITKHYGPLTLVLFERKPGITGLWQIRGRSRLSYPQRRKLDLFLVRHWSFRLYVYILTLTIPRVICGKNAW